MKSLHERGECLLKRTEFANQVCACTNVLSILMGFFDSQSRSISVKWFGFRDASGSEFKHDMVKFASKQLCIWTSVMPEGRSDDFGLCSSQATNAVWSKLGQFMLGVGPAVCGVYPFMIFPETKRQDQHYSLTLTQMGMAYVSHQLTEEFYARSAWMETLVESAMEVLSIQFIAVNEEGLICYDSMKQHPHQADDSDWLLRNEFLSKMSWSENSELKDAISAAISPQGRNSIVSVCLSPGVTRLVAVTPMSVEGTTMALILFENERTDHSKLRDKFFSTYNLTPSEKMISHEILKGRSIAEAAQLNNLAQSTVRSYMKRIFAKTGTHRQSGLVSLYFSSIVPVAINDQPYLDDPA